MLGASSRGLRTGTEAFEVGVVRASAAIRLPSQPSYLYRSRWRTKWETRAELLRDPYHSSRPKYSKKECARIVPVFWYTPPCHLSGV